LHSINKLDIVSHYNKLFTRTLRSNPIYVNMITVVKPL